MVHGRGEAPPDGLLSADDERPHGLALRRAAEAWTSGGPLTEALALADGRASGAAGSDAGYITAPEGAGSEGAAATAGGWPDTPRGSAARPRRRTRRGHATVGVGGGRDGPISQDHLPRPSKVRRFTWSHVLGR